MADGISGGPPLQESFETLLTTKNDPASASAVRQQVDGLNKVTKTVLRLTDAENKLAAATARRTRSQRNAEHAQGLHIPPSGNESVAFEQARAEFELYRTKAVNRAAAAAASRAAARRISQQGAFWSNQGMPVPAEVTKAAGLERRNAEVLQKRAAQSFAAARTSFHHASSIAPHDDFAAQQRLQLSWDKLNTRMLVAEAGRRRLGMTPVGPTWREGPKGSIISQPMPALRQLAQDKKLFPGQSPGSEKDILGFDQKIAHAYARYHVARTFDMVVGRRARQVAGGAIGTSLGIEQSVADATAMLSPSRTGGIDAGSAFSEKAINIAKRTRFEVEAVGDAFKFMVSAGYDAEQTLTSLDAVANFAQAGMMDMSKAAGLLADSLYAMGKGQGNPYQLRKNMQEMGSALIAANIMGNATTEQFAEALAGQFAGQLRLTGKNEAEGLALLNMFAQRGVKGRTAGTQATILLRDLPRAQIRRAAQWREEGMSSFNDQGEMLHVADIIKMFEDKLKPLSTEDRGKVLHRLGLHRRILSSVMMLSGSSEGIRESEQEIAKAQKENLAEKISERRMETAQAQLALLRKEAVLFLAEAVPALKVLIRGMKNVIKYLAETLPEGFKRLALAITGLVGVLSAGVVALMGAKLAAATFVHGSMRAGIANMFGIGAAGTALAGDAVGPDGIPVAAKGGRLRAAGAHVGGMLLGGGIGYGIGKGLSSATGGWSDDSWLGNTGATTLIGAVLGNAFGAQLLLGFKTAALGIVGGSAAATLGAVLAVPLTAVAGFKSGEWLDSFVRRQIGAPEGVLDSRRRSADADANIARLRSNEDYQSELKRKRILMAADNWEAMPEFADLSPIQRLQMENDYANQLMAADPAFQFSLKYKQYVDAEKRNLEERRKIIELEAKVLSEALAALLYRAETGQQLAMMGVGFSETERSEFANQREIYFLRKKLDTYADLPLSELATYGEEAKELLEDRMRLTELEMTMAMRADASKRALYSLQDEMAFKYMGDEEKLIELDLRRRQKLEERDASFFAGESNTVYNEKAMEAMRASSEFADAFSAFSQQLYNPRLTSGVMSDQDVWAAQAFALQRASDVKAGLGSADGVTVEEKVQAILDHLKAALPKNRGANATFDEDLTAAFVYRGLLATE